MIESIVTKNPLQDFIDFLAELNRFEVQFIIVGAHAMSQWGYTRATGDLDIYIIPNPLNATRLMESLRAFGCPTKDLDASFFTKKGSVYQIGLPPLRIDLLTKIDGVSETQALDSCKKGTMLDQPVLFLGLDALIKNKSSTGRPKDKLDIIELKQIKKGPAKK